MATKPSPPGRFSTTTGWPHFAASFSAIRRAPMSAPEPGPSGRRNFDRARAASSAPRDARSADSARRTDECAHESPQPVTAKSLQSAWPSLRSEWRDFSSRRLDAEHLPASATCARCLSIAAVNSAARARVDHLAGGDQPCGDRRICQHRAARRLAMRSRDLGRHVARAEQPDQAVDGDVGKAGLGRGRHIGQRSRRARSR